jgi:hypothetical protein
MPDPQPQPSLQFSVTCLAVDDEKGPPTLQYLFYELPFPAFPFQMERFYIVNCWTNGHGEYRQAVRIVDSSKTRILVDTGAQAVPLPDPYTPFMAINQIADLRFTEAGPYWVQTFLNDTLVLQYPVTVRLAAGDIRIQPPDAAARIRRFSLPGLG